MSDKNINITMAVDDAEMFRTFQREQKEILKLQKQLQKMGRAGKQAGDDTKKGADGASFSLKDMIRSTGQLAAGFAGVGTAVGAVMAVVTQLKAEYDNLIDRQKTAADKQIEFQAAMSDAIFNAGGILSPEELHEAALDISEEGVSPAVAARLLGSSLSARGANNKEEALQAVEASKAAAHLAPHLSSSALTTLAGSGIDLQKQMGGSIEENIGFLLNTGSLARVTTLESLSQNIAPAVIGLNQFGGTAQDNASLVAGIGQGLVDPTGNATGTTAIKLAKQLRERLPDLADTKSRIEAIQNSPEMREAFFKGGDFNGETFVPASFEAKSLPTIEQVFKKDSVIAKSILAGSGTVGTLKEGGETFHKRVEEIQSLPESQAAIIDRKLDASAFRFSLDDIEGGLTAVVRDKMEQNLKAIGELDLAQKIDGLTFEAQTLGGKNPVEVFRETVKNKIDSRLSTVQYISAGVGAPATASPRVVTSEDRKTAEQLQTIYEVLTESLELQKRNQQRAQEVKVVEDKTKTPVKQSRKVPAGKALSK